jgi:ABC-2 type transport system permease protein
MFLPFISSAFVPTETMPAAVRWFAENQPVTGVVNTIRALLNARPVGSDIWVALAWCLGIGGLFWALATRAYGRRQR